MFIQRRNIKGTCYYYLVESKRRKKDNAVIKRFEICLGNKQKINSLFKQYPEVRV